MTNTETPSLGMISFTDQLCKIRITHEGLNKIFSEEEMKKISTVNEFSNSVWAVFFSANKNKELSLDMRSDKQHNLWKATNSTIAKEPPLDPALADHRFGVLKLAKDIASSDDTAEIKTVYNELMDMLK